MAIRAVIFDLDGTITQPYFDFDAIREQMGLERDSGPVLEQMENMTRQAGIRIGILTRNRRSNALSIACKHRLRFDAIVDREDGPAKPDAFGVLRLCQQFGVKPEETLVVGDYLFDLLSARAAGAVAVLLANHERADEFTEHADFKIEKLEQVLQIVEDEK